MSDSSQAGIRRHLGVILACLLLMAGPVFTFLGPVAGVMLFGGWNPRAMYVTACVLNALIPSLFCVWYLAKQGPVGSFRSRPLDLFSGVMCTMCFYPTAMLLSECIGRLSPDGGKVAESVISSTSMGPVVAWMLMVLLPAFSEEILFRGVLFGAFRRYGFPVAAAVSAVAFALSHGTAQQMGYTLLMGIVWAFLREFSGSIFPGLLGHMAFNSVALLAAFQPESAQGQLAESSLASSSALGSLIVLGPLMVLAATGIAAGAILLRSMSTWSVEKPEQEPVWKPGIGLAVLGIVINIVASFLLSSI